MGDEAAHEKDDTMDHRKLAALLRTGKNRIRQVMHTYGITAQSLRKKYVYPGVATEIVPNKLREEAFEWVSNEVVFSDILEVKRADGTGVAAVLRYVTARAKSWGSLSIITCEPIWSPMRLRQWLLSCLAAFGIAKRRKQYGAVQTHSLLLQKGFVLSMSRAGMPTDIGMRNALSASSSWLELHVAPIIRWGRDFASG